MQAQPPSSYNPSAEAARTLRWLAFFVLFVVLPLSTFEARRAGVVMVPMSVALFFLAFVFDPYGRNPTWLRMGLFRPVALSFTALLGWMVISSLWAPLPSDTFEKIFRLLTSVFMILAGLYILPATTKKSHMYLLPVGVGLSAVFGLVSSISHMHDTALFERGAITLLMLLWPALAWMFYRQKIGFLFLLALSGLSVAVLARDPVILVSTIAGALAFYSVQQYGSIVTRFATFGMCGLVLASPFLALITSFFLTSSTTSQWIEGIMLASDAIRADPLHLLAGHGFASSRALAALHEGGVTESLLFSLWFDLGLVGALASVAVMLCLMQSLMRLAQLVQASTIATLTTAVVFWIGNGVTFQSWWLMLLSFSLLSCLALAHAVDDEPRAYAHEDKDKPLNEDELARLS
jgi:hypothetical protein